MHIKGRLFLLRFGTSGRRGRRDSGGGNSELLFKSLHQLMQLYDRERLHLFYNFIEFFCHVYLFFATSFNTTASFCIGPLIVYTNCARKTSRPGIAAMEIMPSLPTYLPWKTPPAKARPPLNFLTNAASSRAGASSSSLPAEAPAKAGPYARAISPSSAGGSP